MAKNPLEDILTKYMEREALTAKIINEQATYLLLGFETKYRKLAKQDNVKASYLLGLETGLGLHKGPQKGLNEFYSFGFEQGQDFLSALGEYQKQISSLDINLTKAGLIGRIRRYLSGVKVN